jgi:hypothetical protein
LTRYVLREEKSGVERPERPGLTTLLGLLPGYVVDETNSKCGSLMEKQ